MRKSPAESATKFRIGTKKEGLDDNNYYVMNDKNNRKRWVKEGCIFVIYKINPDAKNKFWNYGKFPSDWDYVGGGTTVAIQKLNVDIKYPREEQFIGNPKYTIKMKELLTKLFNNLKEKKTIENFKLVTLNGLHSYMNKVNKNLKYSHN